jgi:ribosomal protein S18 acetylase RimI-like enzyme
MPEIEIRPAAEDDIPQLVALDHDYKSNYVWQMDMNTEEGQVITRFREIRLPRAATIEYPRSPQNLLQDWALRDGVLVAVIEKRPIAYISLTQQISPLTAWVTDLVVSTELRRKGIASALVLAAEDWARGRKNRRIILEVQSKNLPAIRMAYKLGFEFCGYNDHYYLNQDIALFFSQFLR